MEFVLTGLRQLGNVRHLTFQMIAADRTRKEVAVEADVDLLRKYSIPLQELPLLCTRFLGANLDRLPATLLAFTEEDMQLHAGVRAAAAAAAKEKKKNHRPPVSSKIGQAWRSPR
jgi:hypothetical protein